MWGLILNSLVLGFCLGLAVSFVHFRIITRNLQRTYYAQGRTDAFDEVRQQINYPAAAKQKIASHALKDVC